MYVTESLSYIGAGPVRGRGRGYASGERGGRGYAGRYTRTNRDDRNSHSGIV